MKIFAKSFYITTTMILLIAWPLASWVDTLLHQFAGEPAWWNLFVVLTGYGL